MNDAQFHPDDYQYGPRTSLALEPAYHQSLNTPSIENLTTILKTWDVSHRVEQFDPLPTLTSIAEIIEQAVDDFLKLDPDPLDDRHPARTHPQAEFGNLLKILFRNDDFMNKLVISYLLGRDQPELSVAAARLLLDCVPGWMLLKCSQSQVTLSLNSIYGPKIVQMRCYELTPLTTSIRFGSAG